MNHLGNKTLDEGGWQEMDNKSSVAWFGGKSHVQLSGWLPEGTVGETNFEDIDFLVIGWRKADHEHEVEIIVDPETGQETITIRR